MTHRSTLRLQTTADGEQHDRLRPLLHVQTVGAAGEAGQRHHGGVLDSSLFLPSVINRQALCLIHVSALNFREMKKRDKEFSRYP